MFHFAKDVYDLQITHTNEAMAWSDMIIFFFEKVERSRRKEKRPKLTGCFCLRIRTTLVVSTENKG